MSNKVSPKKSTKTMQWILIIVAVMLVTIGILQTISTTGTTSSGNNSPASTKQNMF